MPRQVQMSSQRVEKKICQLILWPFIFLFIAVALWHMKHTASNKQGRLRRNVLENTARIARKKDV